MDVQPIAAAGTVWLVRHGESDWNAQGRVQGQAAGPTLTPRGRQQAEELAHDLARRLGPLPVRALYSSDLDRAVQTARPLAAVLGVAIRQDPRLRERCFGALEGTPVALMSPVASGIVDGRVVDPAARPDGGESQSDHYRRAAGFVESLSMDDEPGDIVVVAHGGTVRMLDACLRHRPVLGLPWPAIVNGQVVAHDRPAPSLAELVPATAQPWRST